MSYNIHTHKLTCPYIYKLNILSSLIKQTDPENKVCWNWKKKKIHKTTQHKNQVKIKQENESKWIIQYKKKIRKLHNTQVLYYKQTINILTLYKNSKFKHTFNVFVYSEWNSRDK